MDRYYFPITTIAPSDVATEVWFNGIGLVPRLWDVSFFDWAELGSGHHKLHLHFGAADAMLKGCNLEIAVEAASVDEAARRLMGVHVMLYVHGLAPFSVQMASNYSINHYAGINSRKSAASREMLPEGLRDGITSATAEVEIWGSPYTSAPHIRAPLIKRLKATTFEAAVNDAARWQIIRRAHPVCSFVEQVALTAPAIPDANQSLLHIWTGLESLFPNVQTELSFRLALYLAQLQHAHGDRTMFFERARISYKDRSSIAHGAQPKRRSRGGKQREPWLAAWLLLLQAIQAVILRGGVPSEEDLTKELLRTT